MEEPTFGNLFWTRPHIAPILMASRAEAASVSATTPRDLLREIDLLVRDEERSPHADLYQEAADAANVLSTAISQVDDELAQLARDADPRERQRIKASLDALGPAESNERQAKLEMRQLLERQLVLFRDLESREEEVRAKRDRLVEQLRTLALHLAHLRAQSAMDTATAAEITGQIHSLCAGIDYRIEGVKEVRSMTSHRK